MVQYNSHNFSCSLLISLLMPLLLPNKPKKGNPVDCELKDKLSDLDLSQCHDQGAASSKECPHTDPGASKESILDLLCSTEGGF